MTAPWQRPDGTPWEPTPVEIDRIWHAMAEVRDRPVVARLAGLRRRARSGL